MTTWTVWRQDDDNGEAVEVARCDDRVAALAKVMVLAAGHRQTSWVTGETVSLTNRDLYNRIIDLREVLGERSLVEYLRALWCVSRTQKDRERLAPDEVAAMLTAAVTLTPPAVETGRHFAYERTLTGFDRWEAIILSQIADQEDFLRQPLSEFAYFGVSAPRTSQERATDAYWYNFDPATYLECGMAGSFGGWDESDPNSPRVLVSGPVHPSVPPLPEIAPIETVSWDDLADFALCGQQYE